MNWSLWTLLGVIVVLPIIFPKLLILFVQGVLLALGQIWTNKLRSFLTTIGIVIGVASVTSVIAALTGLETNILNEFEKFGTNKMYVNPMRTSADYARRTPWTQIRFDPRIFDGLLANAPSISAFTREMDWTETVSFEQRKIADVLITGIDASWHDIERRAVTQGRPFSLVDVQRGLPVCLVDPILQDSLSLNRDPSGQSIVIGNRRFTVVGVVEPDPSGGMFRGGSDSGSAYIPFSTAVRMEPREGLTVVVTSRSTQVADDAAAELNFYMRQVRHVQPGGEDNFRVFYVAKEVERFKTVATVIRAVATCIVGISLIVGGVGIMNIMLVSVSERTREIGLRKAVGATPFAILLQFLIEAVTLCCIGGAIGLGIGQALTTLLKSITVLSLQAAYIPFWAVMLSIGFSAVVGLTFGMFPAIKAARLDPIDALRHE
jgi:putative ABC transport system permease protein